MVWGFQQSCQTMVAGLYTLFPKIITLAVHNIILWHQSLLLYQLKWTNSISCGTRRPDAVQCGHKSRACPVAAVSPPHVCQARTWLSVDFFLAYKLYYLMKITMLILLILFTVSHASKVLVICPVLVLPENMTIFFEHIIHVIFILASPHHVFL